MVAEGQLNHCERGELSRRVGLIGPGEDYGVCLDNRHVVLWLTGVRPRRAAVHVAAQMGIEVLQSGPTVCGSRIASADSRIWFAHYQVPPAKSDSNLGIWSHIA